MLFIAVLPPPLTHGFALSAGLLQTYVALFLLCLVPCPSPHAPPPLSLPLASTPVPCLCLHTSTFSGSVCYPCYWPLSLPLPFTLVPCFPTPINYPCFPTLVPCPCFHFLYFLLLCLIPCPSTPGINPCSWACLHFLYFLCSALFATPVTISVPCHHSCLNPYRLLLDPCLTPVQCPCLFIPFPFFVWLNLLPLSTTTVPHIFLCPYLYILLTLFDANNHPCH